MTSSLSSLLQALCIVPGGTGAGAGGRASVQSKVQAPHKSFPRQKTNGLLLPSGIPEITLEDVAQHDDYSDCWVVIYDRVYDVTHFLHSHPGGDDVIMDHAGRDATLAFHGTGHSKAAIELMDEYLIGELPLKERIFRTTNGGKILLSGVPE